MVEKGVGVRWRWRTLGLSSSPFEFLRLPHRFMLRQFLLSNRWECQQTRIEYSVILCMIVQANFGEISFALVFVIHSV